MDGNLIRKEKLLFAELEIGVRRIGDDIAVWVSGGDRPTSAALSRQCRDHP